MVKLDETSDATAVISSQASMLHTSHLYGRERETKLLEEAYDRAKFITDSKKQNEIVLIGGRSGTGKTALANSLHQHVTADNGFFLSGKFEVSHCQDPYAIFAEALAQFTSLVMGDEPNSSADQRLVRIRNSIEEAVGRDGVLLTTMMPCLERIIGVQEATVEVSSTEAKHRFQFVFCNFIHAISMIAPLVLLLDDLQWSDQASLELLHAVLQSGSRSKLLVIATYRDDEFEGTAFSKTLNDTWLNPERLAPIKISKIEVTNLNEISLNGLLADLIQVPSDITWQLALIVHAKSNGNVFFALQYLRLLMENNIVQQGNPVVLKQSLLNQQAWHVKYGTEHSIDQLIKRKVGDLPRFPQEVLEIAACMGDEIDETALSTIFNGKTSEISKALEVAASLELVTFVQARGRFHFLHDRIRQVVFAMIDDPDMRSFEIGYALWQKSSPMFLSTKIFVIVNLLNKGVHQVTDRHERYQAASLNLEAGRKAASLAAFPDAATYLKAALAFLNGFDHWAEDYDLTLSTYNAFIDAELCNQSFPVVKEMIEEVIKHAKSPTDRLVAYSAKINMIGQTGSVHEATRVGLDVLRELGEHLPLEPGTFAIIAEFIKTKGALRGKTNDNILALPSMNDQNKIGAVHILTLLLPYAFQAGYSCCALIGPRLVRLCLAHGIVKSCAIGFVTFAWMLCKGESKEGYRYGQLALNMVERYRAREMTTRVSLSYYFFTHHWTRPLKETLIPMHDSIKMGLEIGDVEYAMFAAYFHGTNMLNCGAALNNVEILLLEALEQMRLFKQDNTAQTTKLLLQYVHNMTGRAPDPKLLRGDVITEKDADTDNVSVLGSHYCLGVDLAYTFGDSNLAQSIVVKRRALPFEQFALYSNALDHFREGLVAVAQARAGIHRRQNVQTARKELKQMAKWAADCPDNFLHKRNLLEAEIQSLGLRGRLFNRNPSTLYDKAIEQALQQGFVQEAALACERAGDYMHETANFSLAESYWGRSHALYLEWGATAKAMHLHASKLTSP